MNFIKDIQFYIHATAKTTPQIDQSIINFYHLSIILKGKFTYYIDGQELILEENDAILLCPGTDRKRLCYNEHADYIIFNFSAPKDCSLKNTLFKNINQPIKTLLNAYPYRFYKATNYKHYIGREYEHYDGQEKDKVIAILHNIFNCILVDLFDSLKYSTQNQHVLNTLKFINKHINEPLTLDSVCRKIHLSKEYTARVFKREIGITVTQYINQQKLDIAKNILINDELDLQTVAKKVGFENYNYFSRIFKKYFGITPTTMKMELKKASREATL